MGAHHLSLNTLARAASDVPYPYRSEYGLGRIFRYVNVPEDGSKRKAILESISDHATQYLTPERSSNSRNAITVAVRMRDKDGHLLGPGLYIGEFIIGGDSYVARTQKGAVIIDESLSNQRLVQIQLPTGSGKMKVPRLEELVAQIEPQAQALIRQHNTADEGRELFVCPVLMLDSRHLFPPRPEKTGEGAGSAADQSTFVKMPLLTISSAYEEKAKSDWVNEHYKMIKERVLPFIVNERPITKGPLANSSVEQRGLISQRAHANAACRVLFDRIAIETELTGSEEGCFSEAFDSSFLDSEQAFLNLFAQRELNKLLRYEIPDLGSDQQAIHNVATIEFEILTQRDMCSFCRGTVSSLLGSGWLAKHTERWLESLPEDLKRVITLDATQPLIVRIFAYSLALAPKDQQRENARASGPAGSAV